MIANFYIRIAAALLGYKAPAETGRDDRAEAGLNGAGPFGGSNGDPGVKGRGKAGAGPAPGVT